MKPKTAAEYINDRHQPITAFWLSVTVVCGIMTASNSHSLDPDWLLQSQ